MMIKAYPKEYYEKLKNRGYRMMYFENVITHLPEYHYHDYYELSIVLNCNHVSYICSDHEYPLLDGDIILCNVFEPHFYKETGPSPVCERINLGIEFMKLLKFSTPDINLHALFQKYNSSYPIIHLGFRQMLKYYELVDIYKRNELRHGGEILELACAQLLLSYTYEDTYPYLSRDIQNTESTHVVMHIVEYINQHLSENITLSQLAKEENYSVSYICSAFKSIMNKTITSYIKESRLDLVVQYLLKTDLSIMDSAEKAGFNNYSYFYKAFKNVYGVSPVEYRHQNRIISQQSGGTEANTDFK